MRRGEYAMVAQEKTTKRSFFCVVGSLVDANNNEQCFDRWWWCCVVAVLVDYNIYCTHIDDATLCTRGIRSLARRSVAVASHTRFFCWCCPSSIVNVKLKECFLERLC